MGFSPRETLERVKNWRVTAIYDSTSYAFEQDIEGITYKGYSVRYSIDRIGLPYLNVKNN